MLGEGLRWDARRDELLWVDILAGQLFRERVSDSGELVRVRDYRIDATLGAVAPVDGDDGWLLAAGRGFARLGIDGHLTWLATPLPEGCRMNDAVVDPLGRMWAGSLAMDLTPGAGALTRLDRDGTVAVVHEGLTIANGIGWSPDGGRMYVVDSHERAVHVFDIDDVGELSGHRTSVTFESGPGTPDGLAVDSDGNIWVAFYDGGRVHCHAPDGRLLVVVEVPERQTTSVALMGTAPSFLFVTTATEHWTAAQRAERPDAGAVFVATTSARGVPAALFRPQGDWWPGVDTA